jgi:hypothetical protein
MDALEGEQLHHLLEIKNSKRYVDRLSASIKHHLDVADRLAASIHDMRAKREELTHSLSQLFPQLENLLQRVRTAKGIVAEALSKQYNNRTVNILE